MKLLPPKSQNAAALHLLISKRSASSIELRRFTLSSYPPARIRNLRDRGVSIYARSEKYVTKDGKSVAIARYFLATPIKVAAKIYESINV